MSLYAMGSPARTPPAPRRSARRASFNASSGRKVTMAFTLGFKRSICAMKAFTTSTAETLRVRSRRASFRAGRKLMSEVMSSERDVLPALELEHLARLVGRGDGEAELLENAADLRHLVRVAPGEGALADPQAVLEADAHVAAHHRGLHRDVHLVAPAAQHPPEVIGAEQAIGGAPHVPG